jgi:hypothetical protein
MNGGEPQPMPQPALACDQIVYRVLASAKLLDFLPQAFLLRLRDKDTGLSISYNCTLDEARYSLTRSYGVLSLHVGRVRTLNLDVVPDEPQHANIIGLPYKEDNPELAERMASLLAKQARIVDQGLRKRPESATTNE